MSDSKLAAFRLAQAVDAATTAYENSYDRESADAATEASHNGRGKFTLVDYSSFYGITLKEAVEQTVEPDLRMPVYLLINSNWNDVSDWARHTLANPPAFAETMKSEG